MPRIFAFLLAALLTSAATQPPANVDIAAGETVTLRVGNDGQATVENRGPAGPLSELETAFMQQAVRTAIVPGVKSQPAFSTDTPKPPPPVTPGLLRIRLRAVPPPMSKGANGDMLLSLENGYEGALRYHAVLHKGDRSQTTDVCIVLPRKQGFEEWPYLFDRI